MSEMRFRTVVLEKDNNLIFCLTSLTKNYFYIFQQAGFHERFFSYMRRLLFRNFQCDFI